MKQKRQARWRKVFKCVLSADAAAEDLEALWEVPTVPSTGDTASLAIDTVSGRYFRICERNVTCERTKVMSNAWPRAAQLPWDMSGVGGHVCSVPPGCILFSSGRLVLSLGTQNTTTCRQQQQHTHLSSSYVLTQVRIQVRSQSRYHACHCEWQLCGWLRQWRHAQFQSMKSSSNAT